MRLKNAIIKLTNIPIWIYIIISAALTVRLAVVVCNSINIEGTTTPSIFLIIIMLISVAFNAWLIYILFRTIMRQKVSFIKIFKVELIVSIINFIYGMLFNGVVGIFGLPSVFNSIISYVFEILGIWMLMICFTDCKSSKPRCAAIMLIYIAIMLAIHFIPTFLRLIFGI